MKIIINASIQSGGGGLQVALSFINECIHFNENKYYVFVNNSLFSQINTANYPSNFNIILIPSLRFFQYQKYLSRLESEIIPDVVFSVFGPVYWRPNAPHIMGFAHGYYIYNDSPFWSIIPNKEKLKIFIKKYIHLFFIKRDADYYIVETTDVANRLQKEVGNKKIYCVSNTYSDYFSKFKLPNVNLLPPRKNGEFRLIYVCSSNLHKNLGIIPKTLNVLFNRGYSNIYFYLTIDKEELPNIFEEDIASNIIPIGKITQSDCPSVYYECDATFVPTLLECFTANYPESMKMSRPILTSNLDFAYSICGEAAIYFNPLDPEDIANKICLLIESNDLYKELVHAGEKRLDIFPTATERTSSYLDICKEIIDIEREKLR